MDSSSAYSITLAAGGASPGSRLANFFSPNRPASTAPLPSIRIRPPKKESPVLPSPPAISIARRRVAPSERAANALALLQAIRAGEFDRVRTLLQADPGLVSLVPEGQEPALACAVEAGHTEVIRLVVRAGDLAYPNQARARALRQAIAQQGFEEVLALLRSNPELVRLPLEDQSSVLSLVVKSGDIKMLEAVLPFCDAGDLDGAREAAAGKTAGEVYSDLPLSVAIKMERVDLVARLLKSGANPNVEDTPFDFCVPENRAIAAVLKFYGGRPSSALCEAMGAIPEVGPMDASCLGPWARPQQRWQLKLPAKPVQNEIVYLQYRPEVDPQERQPATTAALVKAVQGGNFGEVSQLLAAGEDPNRVRWMEEHPLYIANAAGNEALLELLLSWGANPNLVDPMPRPAAALGLRHSSNTDDSSSRLLCQAARRQSPGAVWLLLTYGAHAGTEAMHQFAYYGLHECFLAAYRAHGKPGPWQGESIEMRLYDKMGLPGLKLLKHADFDRRAKGEYDRRLVDHMLARYDLDGLRFLFERGLVLSMPELEVLLHKLIGSPPRLNSHDSAAVNEAEVKRYVDVLMYLFGQHEDYEMMVVSEWQSFVADKPLEALKPEWKKALTGMPIFVRAAVVAVMQALSSPKSHWPFDAISPAHGRNKLTSACFKHDRKTLLLYLSRGADPHARDGHDSTALLTAIEQRAHEFVEILVRHKSTFVADAMEPTQAIEKALISGDARLLVLVLQKFAPASEQALAALLPAAGQDERMAGLLKQAFRLRAVLSKPLQGRLQDLLSAEFGYTSRLADPAAVELLLAAGARPSPWMLEQAYAEGSLDVAELLGSAMPIPRLGRSETL